MYTIKNACFKCIILVPRKLCILIQVWYFNFLKSIKNGFSTCENLVPVI